VGLLYNASSTGPSGGHTRSQNSEQGGNEPQHAPPSHLFGLQALASLTHPNGPGTRSLLSEAPHGLEQGQYGEAGGGGHGLPPFNPASPINRRNHGGGEMKLETEDDSQSPRKSSLIKIQNLSEQSKGGQVSVRDRTGKKKKLSFQSHLNPPRSLLNLFFFNLLHKFDT